MKACDLQNEAVAMVGDKNMPRVLDVYKRYWSHRSGYEIQLRNEKTKEIFASMLPDFIRNTTDEILQKIDEIDFLVNSKSPVEEY